MGSGDGSKRRRRGVINAEIREEKWKRSPKGDKVKVTVRFRGREITHSSLGKELLLRFRDAAEEFGEVDKGIKMEGRNMAMFITPKKN